MLFKSWTYLTVVTFDPRWESQSSPPVQS